MEDSWKDLNGVVTAPSIVTKEVLPLSPRAEAIVKIEGQKAEDDEFLEAMSVLSGVSQKVYPTSGIANQGTMLLELGIKVGHAFDHRSGETDTCPPAGQPGDQNNVFAISGLILFDDHEGYRSDDIESELENYVDALNTMGSELETDSERTKLDPGFFNSISRGTDPSIDGNLELQTQSAGSGYVGSLKSVKIKDETHNISESTSSVDLSYQPLWKGTVFEATSGSEINKFKTGKLEKTGEDVKLVPSSSYLTYYENCYPKQSNTTIFVPISGGASSSSCMTDSTFIDFLDFPSDVLEEINPTEHSEGKISDKVDMPCDPSEIEDGTLPGKASSLFFNDSTLDLKVDGQGRLTGDLANKTSSNYLEDSDEENKQVESSLQCPVDRGVSEKIISLETLTTCQMPKPPQEHAESSILDILTVVEDSLHDSMEGNETNSVDQFSPKSSAFSLEIVSSIFQFESLTTEVRNISMSEDELVHPQSPASSRNVDVEEREPAISPAIAFELEHSSNADEAQESAAIDMVESLPSGCGENPNALQLQPKDLELIEKNGKTHVRDSLEFVDVSNKLSVWYDELLLEESMSNDSNAGKVITADGLHDQVLHMFQSAKVSSFDVHSLKDLISQTDTSCQPNPDIEEPSITRDSAFSLSQNKPFVPFALNEDLEIFDNAASRGWPSAQDLSNSFDDKLVYANVDDIHVELHPSLEGHNICSRENNQDSDSKYENVISEEGTTVKVLSLLQSSKGCSFDLNILRDPISEDAALNQYKLESDKSEIADSNSKSENKITEDGTDGEYLSLLQSLDISNLDAQLQENHFSEDSSLNQHKKEAEEPVISSDLTFLKFERKIFVPLSRNRNQHEFVGASSSSQLFSLDLSNFTDVKLADDNQMKFYHHTYEANLACCREDEQDFDSKASMQHFQVDAGRLEVQPQQASISQAVEEPITVPLRTGGDNIDPYDIRFNEVCSDQPIDSQNNLEQELVTLCDQGCNSMMSIPSSRIDETKQTKFDLFDPFQDITEYPGSSIARVALTSESPLVADFIIPNSLTSAREPFEKLADEMISRFQIREDNEEAPPLPPLPPLQWRIVKPRLESLVASEHIAQPVEKTNPCILRQNTGQQKKSSFVTLSAQKERFQQVSSSTDGMLESEKLSELPPISMDLREQLEITSSEVKTVHSSDLSLIMPSEEDGKHADGNVAVIGESTLTIPLLKDQMPQHPDLLEAGNLEETGQKLVKFLAGFELEGLQEPPIIDRDALTPLNSFPVMSTTRDGNCQYMYGDYGGFEGEGVQHHNFSGLSPIAAYDIPHYDYHMFVKGSNSYNVYDILPLEMKGDKPNEKPYSIRNRPRDHLIEAVVAQDKSTMRRVSELGWPLTKPPEDERNYLLEQIKNKVWFEWL
ncbi:SCAR-like protein 1 [Dendrobium catenatum]|uniref:Protein SCAR n=1 Tax=Dendrobium catenatum TaxID=906689 RepID=A0A2I0WFK2_9ASPA|nr:SCAR-like protein 1 [Dendrobium catenatum]